MKKSNLYIDESGKASLADYTDDLFILTGVILDQPDVNTVEGFFNYIKLKYGLSVAESFHSYEVFERYDTKLSDSELIDLNKRLADFISLIPAKIHIAVISKSEFRDALGITSVEDFKGCSDRKELKNFSYRIMAAYIFAKFGEYLSKNESVGQVIADSRRGADHQLLKTLNNCKEGAVPINSTYQKIINEKVSAICFAEKNFLSGGLEITDIISYISYNWLKTDSFFHKSGLDGIWNQIKNKSEIETMNEDTIRKFFDIKKDEVHKYLK